MKLESLELRNFRSFGQARFAFPPGKTVILGPNTSGKSNILEALYLLAAGRSLKASRDRELINTLSDHASIEASVEDITGEKKSLLIQLTSLEGERGSKRFKVNGVSRGLSNFSGNFAAVIFEPEDIQLVLGGPDLRRAYLNNVLSLVDRAYRRALAQFDEVRRQRNHLLEAIREKEQKVSDLEFWDEKILELAPLLSQSRSGFFDFLSKNSRRSSFSYFPSLLSRTRLNDYQDREIASGTTLIGPHRDDFAFGVNEKGKVRDLSVFGSRGEQRMAIFDLKMLEIGFLQEKLGAQPVLLLDDIFSELDHTHREEIAQRLGSGQVILTTTENSFASNPFLNDSQVLTLDGD